MKKTKIFLIAAGITAALTIAGLVIGLVILKNQNSAEAEVDLYIIYDSGGGNEIPVLHLTRMAQILNIEGYLSVPVREGYDFKGWYTDDGTFNIELGREYFNENTSFTGEITVYAKWATGVYTVVFVTNGGTAVQTQTKEYGDYLSRPKTTNAGYELYGWYKDNAFAAAWDFDSDKVTGNVTLYAKWVEMPQIYTQGLTFTEVEKYGESYYEVRVGTATAANIIIPSRFNGKNVKKIADNGFMGKTNIVSVTILSGITTIGEGAFSYCTGLSEIIIPDGMQEIGMNAFSFCVNLKSLTIPDIANGIRAKAFSDCMNLTEIYLNATALSCGQNVFSKAGENAAGITVYIGASVSIIPDYMFASSKVVRVIFAEGSACKSIGNYAFNSCKSLETIEMPDSITSIGDCSFRSCTNLKNIVIPEKITSIGGGAFYECTNLSGSVSIPNGVNILNTGVFESCFKLEEVVLSSGLISIGENAFWQCSSLSRITIPEGVMHIGTGAFYNCKSLKSLTIPDSVFTVGVNAFLSSGLTEITFGSGVVS
ncbi:MAG: leucine-rich repeat protein, partial [Clostridiales bacterium]|nr:leucine-rich repeat protein [Clostridiales bacterium]